MNERSADLGGAQGEWYWCLKHQRVEPRAGCRAEDRLGPYPTPAAAQDWRARLEERNSTWDAEDRAWDEGGT